MKKIVILTILSLLILSGCSKEEKNLETTETTEIPATESQIIEEIIFKENEFELKGKKYSIDLPEEFIVDTEEKDLFSAEIESIGIYIYSISKDDFQTKEEIIEVLKKELQEESEFELVEDDFIKNEQKVGMFDSTEFKFSVRNVDTMNTAKIYIIDKDKKDFIILSMMGFDTFYEDTEKVDRILSSFKTINN
ncbi:lipoprotein [Peptostreptococcaceae bacterium OttesenSCG-928-C18]|nr:lipoprotein [Peptostreptococcaceae bacterium OttesenSCG-928-C18]